MKRPASGANAPNAGNAQRTAPPLHLGLAEQGKIHAVAGEHDIALLYYRQAMRQAVESKAPEVFFRHYLECSIESLELLGHYQDVLDYCRRVERHYRDRIASDEQQAVFIARDLMANAQRAGLVLVKMGLGAEARRWLDEATQRAGDLAVDLPLVSRVVEWLDRGFQISADRVVAEQRRACYFAVTKQSLNPGLAVRLPPQVVSQGVNR